MKSRHLLLINPWISDFAAYDLWSKPLGLLYVGKFLKTYGYDISLIDLLDRNRWQNHENHSKSDGRGKYLKTIIEKPRAISDIPRRFGLYGATKSKFKDALLCESTPDAILVTSLMTYWYIGLQETVDVIREIFPDVPIILGGIYATLYPDHAQKNINPDYIITGYGEKQSLILLDSIFGINRDYSVINDFDDQGLPPWHLYKNITYAPIMTSRGCPYNCTYCATNILNPKFIQRNPDDVISEILQIHSEFGVRHFPFYDDALFFNRDNHIIPILRAITEEELDLVFHTPNGLFANQINEELTILMKSAGFKTIRLSLESTQHQIQKASSYKVTNDNIIDALNFLESAGFNRSEIEIYLIMGLPQQSYNAVLDSMKFVADQGAISRLASFSPIPGTKEWKKAKKLGYVFDDMDPLLTNNSVYICKNRDFTYDNYLELRQMSNELNQKARTHI